MSSRPLLVLLVLTGCNPDAGITKFNNDPEATITSHEDGDAVDEGYVVTFRGTVSDTNHGAEDLVATWFSGADELCAEAPVSSSGETVCEAVLGVDDDEVVLEGRDPENATGTARVELVVNATDAPVAEITAPTGSGRYYAGFPIAVEAVVSDAEDDPDTLAVTWTDETGNFVTIDATPEDGALAGEVTFDAGEHSLTLNVIDETGKLGTATVDFTVGAESTAPDCAITGPLDGASAELGASVDLAATASDVDQPADTLVATWSSDVDGALGGAAVGADGTTTHAVTSLSFGTHLLTLTVTDDTGLSCTDEVVFTVGTPPEVAIDAPRLGELYNEGEVISFLATVSDSGTAPEALVLAWESDVDGLLDATGADSSGLAAFDADWLSPGDHVVTLTATDPEGLYAEAMVAFTVNGLPSAPTLEIAPAAPATGDDLVASLAAAAVDPEGDALTYTWAWTRDGAATAYATNTVPADATAKGEVWEVTVVANDGYGDGAPAAASVTIGNTAPTLGGVTLSPDPAAEGDTLTCAPDAATDADGDGVSYSYAWTVNGLAIASTDASLGDTWWSAGDTVACAVTPTDGTTSGAAVTSNTVSIDNSAPSITSVAITPAGAAADDTLTCAASGYADPDGDADQTTYAWTVNGVSAGAGDTLAGVFVGGDVVACVATPFDGAASGTALSDALTIANTPPVLAGVTLTPASPTVADTLTCTPGAASDIDGDSVSYTYAWTVDGGTIAATTSTLTSADFGRGDVVRCRVTPNDGTDDGAAMTSGAVTVDNTAPTIASVTLSDTSPGTNDTLSVVVSSSDADGDAVSYTYAWYVNGVAVATSATLSGSYFGRGDSVYVRVTPTDGTDAGTAMSSSTATVGNTAPTVAGAAITPTTAYAGDTLTCAPSGGADVDGDSVSYTYAWTVDGAAAGSGSTLSSGFTYGDVVACTVTPTDGTDSGASATSSGVTIANSAPVVASVSLTPTTVYEATTLTCTPSGTTDADGTTSFTYTYAWYVNGALIAPTSSTLTGTYFAKGNTVYCRAAASDGTSTGSAATSSTVTVSNTAPVLSSVTLSPTLAYTNDTLTASVSSSDADGDSVSYTYAWYVNGSAVAATSSTLSGATYFSKGNTVYVRVTPTDGTTAGSASSSSTLTIGNSTPSAPTVYLDPSDPEEGLDPIVCAIDTAASDADGDSLTYTFTWTRNGSSYTGASSTSTTSTVPAAATAEGDVYACSATASDGSATSSAGTDSVEVVGASYTIGYASVFASPGTGSAGGNYLLGQQITVSSAADLYALGFYLRLADTDSARLALYTNSGSAPGTLVAYTDLTDLSSYAAGSFVELDVVGGPVSIAAGTYWIMWNFSGTVYTGYTTSGASANTIYYKSYSASSTPPSSYGSGSTYTGQYLNLYMVVR